MENCHLEEPERTAQWPLVPCPGCGALEPEDCQCPLSDTPEREDDRKEN